MFRNIFIAILMMFSISVYAKGYGIFQIDKRIIVSVYDGDTFFITDPTCNPVLCERIGVRLFGIDTPEKRTRCAAEKSLAMDARKVLVELINNGSYIELHNTTKEKYGRVMGDLYIDGKNVADILVAKGLAVRYFGDKKQTDWCTNTRLIGV